MKKIIFSVLLVLFSMQLHAQCEANAGGSVHRCDVDTPLFVDIHRSVEATDVTVAIKHGIPYWTLFESLRLR